MLLLTAASENAVHINPVFRFILYFIMCVPMTVGLGTLFLKIISIFILPWKVCFYISIALGIIVTIFLLVLTIGIEIT
ncbi:hypothetical protein B5723_15005 [Mammaliicoccus sciuri]|uniref:hypothetical protein n=1 Tax=Mammaliicoccus sciuri TaxID=1296 RepID=UPI000A037E61|nr:hypothetical protein [Mammaliicoccus sciuri]ORI00182.1 hypothetical protein B5723_15005 [Mammaliicoccus sciuri]